MFLKPSTDQTNQELLVLNTLALKAVLSIPFS